METLIISSSFTHPPRSINHVSSIKIHAAKRRTITASINNLQQYTTSNNTLTNLEKPQPHNQNSNIFKKKSLLATIFNALDDFVCAYLDSPLPPSIDPEHVLSRNNAPVDGEIPPTPCEVALEGGRAPLPSCLDGAYIRIGPNPQFIPKGRPYHLFDGDGMLHTTRISGGKATFCRRYVKTHKYMVEREVGYPFVPSLFASFGNGIVASFARLLISAARVLVGQFDPLNQGFGVANTSVALFSGGLFALCESDLPYRVKVTEEGDIITLGRHNFHSTEPFSLMTAHPKINRETGEVFAYQYNFLRPFLKFFRIDSEGIKQNDVAINSIEECTFTHDFAVTENYAIFSDTQIVVNPLLVLSGRSPVVIDSGKIPRLGVIGKYAEDDGEMWWAHAPGLNMFHCVNSWEEDGGATIVIVCVNAVIVEEVLERIELAQLTLEKITIDVKAKKVVQRHPLSSKFLDLGVVNPSYAGKNSRYVYMSIVGSESVIGVVKLDISLANDDGRDCTVASHLFEPGFCGGEPFFVSRDPNDPTLEEDDGYLVTYIHDENNGESKFVVMDAKSATLDITAAVKLPCRIPNSFHGIFVSESDLKKLRFQ